MKKLLLAILTILLFIPIYAQQPKSKNVCGEIDYVVPETQTLAEAKQTALTQARLQAIADEFGTIVSQTSTVAIHNANEKSNTTFNSFSENDVRGIWIEDTKEPSLSVIYQNEMMVIHAKVCGKARELKNNPVELEVKTLSYGNYNNKQHPDRPGYETTQFKNGDFYGVRFRTPVKGYVALFLRDENTGIVYTQLPYEGTNGYAREVKSNQAYVFMNNQDPEYTYGSSSILTTDRKMEHNTLIVVFSKKEFHLSLPDSEHAVKERFPEIELSKFQKWIHSLRNFDETVQVEEIVITIMK